VAPHDTAPWSRGVDPLVSVASVGKPLRVWDARSGRHIRTFRGVAWGNGVALSRDGRRIAFPTGPRRVRVSSTATGKRVAELRGSGLSLDSVSFDTRGRRVVAGESLTGSGQAQIWSVRTGEMLQTLHGETEADRHTAGINTARFSPNGNLAVTASPDKTARVWNVDTGASVAVLRGHDEYVTDAAFSPNGRFVVTASFDGTARVWVTTGRNLMVLRGHGGDGEGSVSGAVFTSDGRSVETTTAQGRARILACDACLPVDDLLDLAVARAPRALTDEERRTYLHE